MLLSRTKELGKTRAKDAKDANLSGRMWRPVQSPPLLHATFGSITVKSCHLNRRRLISGGVTVRQPQNCFVPRNPWRSFGIPSENKFEAKVPRRGRIVSAVDTLMSCQKQSLSEDAWECRVPVDHVPQEPFSVVL